MTQPKLTIAITAPTFEAIIVEQGTGMVVSGSNRLGGPATAEVDRYQITTHFTRPVTTIILIILPKLTRTIIAPTLDGVIVEDGTGMVGASTNCLGSSITTEVNRCQIITHFIRLVTTIIVATLPELTIIISPPTLDTIIVEDDTGVLFASADCLGGPTTTQIDGNQTAAHFISTITTRRFVTIA